MSKATRRVLIININMRAATLAGCRKISRALKTSPRNTAINIVHWKRVDPHLFKTQRPTHLVLGPNETPFPSYPNAFDDFLRLNVRPRRMPTLGICGGHQALCIAFGSPVGPVHPVPAATQSYAGMPKIEGTCRIRLLSDPDPLLDGLPLESTFFARHVDEAKEVPPNFRLLGVGDPCHIQIIRSDRRPLYGVQCHPEIKVPGYDHGQRLMHNFLEL